jgi:hypothetical protein
VGGSTPPTPEPPTVELLVPVYHEVDALRPSIERLHAYLADSFPLSTRITVADNGSTDGTWELALTLRDELPGVRAVRLEEKGLDLALHAVTRRRTVVLTCANALATILRFVSLVGLPLPARRPGAGASMSTLADTLTRRTPSAREGGRAPAIGALVSIGAGPSSGAGIGQLDVKCSWRRSPPPLPRPPRTPRRRPRRRTGALPSAGPAGSISGSGAAPGGRGFRGGMRRRSRRADARLVQGGAREGPDPLLHRFRGREAIASWVESNYTATTVGGVTVYDLSP